MEKEIFCVCGGDPFTVEVKDTHQSTLTTCPTCGLVVKIKTRGIMSDVKVTFIPNNKEAQSASQ